MSFVVQILVFCVLHFEGISGNTDFGDQILAHNDSFAIKRPPLERLETGSQSTKSEVTTAGYDWNLPKRGSRGFDDYFGDRFSNSMDGDNNGWSPFTLSGQRDMVDSDSTVNWNVQKKDINRQTTSNGDFQAPPFGPDYADMMMMMQIMKKMDNASPKPGLLTRILDNPTTLVMVTFIPISLLIAAALPVFTNIMMNGLTIPPILPTPSGKARNFEEDASVEFHAPILRNLIDFGSRYLDNPECLHRIFCEMATGNGTEQNYLRRAFDTATFMANDKLLENFGIKSFVHTIKSGKCDLLPCGSMTEKSKSNLKDLMNDIMFKHSMSTKPNMR